MEAHSINKVGELCTEENSKVLKILAYLFCQLLNCVDSTLLEYKKSKRKQNGASEDFRITRNR